MEPVQSSKSILYQTVYLIVILSFSLLANAQESTNSNSAGQESPNNGKTQVNQPKSEQLDSANPNSKSEQIGPSNSKNVHKPTNSAIESRIQNLLKQSKRSFEYSEAAKYTHLKWSERMNKYSVGLLPVLNYSGIPIEARDESTDYYDHGKLPVEINHLFRDTLTTSRQFNLNQRKPDYWLQLTIEEYHQPFPFAANDKWWQTARDTVDRAFTSAKPATVKLSLKVTAGERPFRQWKDAASMTISNCDLNTTPQALSSINNQNQILKDYLSTTPGQAFLSASNFLIIQTVKRLAEEVDYAHVE
ncbi:MAG: hypothetical protein OQK04_03495, partial [Kangiellaceae bacterium]|nr:hypothetical protein [Kangiellaceae bacterium]